MNIDVTEAPRVVAPLVARHAEDAAFYWSQLDSSAHSTRIGLDKYAHFNQLLDAHLEGLAVAGRDGVAPALTALQRWIGAGEAFACGWLAAQQEDPESMAEVLGAVRKSPDSLLRGLISALAWMPRDVALDWVGRLSESESHPADQVAVLRAAALLGREGVHALKTPLSVSLSSSHAPVRAAACRASARAGDESLVSPLLAALKDAELAVQAEAAIALARCGEAKQAAPVLWQSVARQAASHEQTTGWHRKLAARRLTRWTRYLALMAPLGHSDMPQLLQWLPTRIGLTFILYHGDCIHLPHVIDKMDDPAVARYAGWVWQTLTGIDLAASGLALPDPEDDEAVESITEARLDADQGLVLPNASLVRACHTANVRSFPQGVRCLLGKELSPSFALDVLETAPQAVRSIAAQALMHVFPGTVVTVRGPAHVQRRQIAELRERIAA